MQSQVWIWLKRPLKSLKVSEITRFQPIFTNEAQRHEKLFYYKLPLDVQALYPIFMAELCHPTQETNFHLYSQPLSFCHYPKLMTIDEGWHIDWLINWRLWVKAQVPLHHNGLVQCQYYWYALPIHPFQNITTKLQEYGNFQAAVQTQAQIRVTLSKITRTHKPLRQVKMAIHGGKIRSCRSSLRKLTFLDMFWELFHWFYKSVSLNTSNTYLPGWYSRYYSKGFSKHEL